MKENKGYIFVATPLKINCKLPFKLIPNYSLRKATKIQIKRIKIFLNQVINLNASSPNWYEIRVVPNGTNNKSHSYHPLNPKDWKYYVISYEGWGDERFDLQYSSNLSTTELQFGAVFTSASMGWNRNIFNYFSSIELQPEFLMENEISKDDLSEIVKIYEEITNINLTYEYIKQAIKMFDDIKLIPKRASLYVLGLFAIIELLITHQPAQNQMGTSITHQIKKKVPLLFNRFNIPIEYSNYFKKAQGDKIWEILYKYRSHNAHGREINFKKDFDILNDREKILDFLYKITKNLLRYALIEPQLYSDLKAC